MEYKNCYSSMRILSWRHKEAEEYEEIIKRLTSLSSAQPEIIRCKNCQYYEADIMGNPYGVCCHPDWVINQIGQEVDEDGWCYRSEREIV